MARESPRKEYGCLQQISLVRLMPNHRVNLDFSHAGACSAPVTQIFIGIRLNGTCQKRKGISLTRNFNFLIDVFLSYHHPDHDHSFLRF